MRTGAQSTLWAVTSHARGKAHMSQPKEWRNSTLRPAWLLHKRRSGKSTPRWSWARLPPAGLRYERTSGNSTRCARHKHQRIDDERRLRTTETCSSGTRSYRAPFPSAQSADMSTGADDGSAIPRTQPVARPHDPRCRSRPEPSRRVRHCLTLSPWEPFGRAASALSRARGANRITRRRRRPGPTSPNRRNVSCGTARRPSTTSRAPF